MSTPVRTEFDRRVELIEHVWIPISDGCRLSARIWLPEDAAESPVPAVMEYVPYRKNDNLALRDAPIHGYFAGCGYASVRVDIRGSGDSDGILEDEYLPLEQTDGVEVVRWLASQPWCTGKVGIIGKSWGGFNGLQIAALAPDELGAVISVASTDDRYADDVHYMGGCLLASNMLQWASVMLAYDARPPDPTVVGEAWREIWLDRMERTPPFLEAWVEHQRRDDFWKQGSVCEDYSAIKVPVYMVGGWTDAYRNAILRFLEGYAGPSKGLIGPWAHVYPESGAPGPAIGFLQEAVRWWDCHLKGVDNGIMDEPKLRVYMADSVMPDPGRSYWPGRWLATESWPSPEVVVRTLRLAGDGTLVGEDGTQPADRQLTIKGAQAPAADAGTWGGHGGPVDNPADQRPEDGQSLCFDTEPLAETVEILGFPIAHLEVASDQPLALVVARLNDIWPDGTSHLITRGLLNLTHRDSDENPEPLAVGERYLVARAAQLDRLLGPRRPPPAPGRVAHLLAMGVAVTRGGEPQPLHGPLEPRRPRVDGRPGSPRAPITLRRAGGSPVAASRGKWRRGRRSHPPAGRRHGTPGHRADRPAPHEPDRRRHRVRLERPQPAPDRRGRPPLGLQQRRARDLHLPGGVADAGAHLQHHVGIGGGVPPHQPRGGLRGGPTYLRQVVAPGCPP